MGVAPQWTLAMTELRGGGYGVRELAPALESGGEPPHSKGAPGPAQTLLGVTEAWLEAWHEVAQGARLKTHNASTS